jgi:RecA-family ATPase
MEVSPETPVSRVDVEPVPPGLVIKAYPDLVAEPLLVPPQVIDSVLYKGGKMIVGGTSKGRKTWSLMDLASAVATGQKWWGFQVNLGDVLYLNFELQEFLFRQRMEAILKARKVKDASRLFVMNLRGKAADMTVLRPIIKKRRLPRGISAW